MCAASFPYHTACIFDNIDHIVFESKTCIFKNQYTIIEQHIFARCEIRPATSILVSYSLRLRCSPICIIVALSSFDIILLSLQ